MACNNSFASNYLLISPEKAGVIDLICFLFNSNIDKAKFVDCPKGTKMPFASRWLIFIFTLLATFLRLIEKPAGKFGDMLEKALNLIYVNTNIFMLIYNAIWGKIVPIPAKTSAKYMSFVSFVDMRRKLDENIKPGDSRYIPHLSIMAAKAAYENEAFIESLVTNDWNMEFLKFYDCWNDYLEVSTTQAFLFRKDPGTDSELIFVSFRVTEGFDSNDWITDIDFSWYEIPGLGRLHAGFLKALGQQKNLGWPKNIVQIINKKVYAYYTIREKLKDLLDKNPEAKFVVTGHSLGAALAILFPAILSYHEETSLLERLAGVYTHGQPRVGNEKFAKYMDSQIKNNNLSNYYRIVYCNDIVARLPFDNKLTEYKHFGTCAYFNSFYKGRIVDEVPNKNYFSMVIPKFFNSIWELKRSFILGWVLGRDYSETISMQILRVVFLFFVGLPSHLPSDYVNSTKLAPTDLFKSASLAGENSTKNGWKTKVDVLVQNISS